MDQDDKSGPDGASGKTSPALSPAKQAEKQRLAEALRANLRRRKAFLRERRTDKAGESGSGQE